MLVLLSQAQAAERWQLIRASLESALPPILKASPERFTNILKALLAGDMQCWIADVEAGTKRELLAVIITCFSVDEVSGTKNFMIYSMQGFQFIPPEEWRAGWATLVAFAKSNGCDRMCAYTNSRSIVKMWSEMGGHVDYVFATVDL